MSIRLKLILSLTAILVGTFIFISAYNYKVASESVRQKILHSALPLTRDNIYSELQASLMRPIFVSSLMANDTFLKDWALDGERDIGKITRYLEEIRSKYGFFTSFFVSASSNYYYYYGGILKKISREDSHDVWYYNFIKMNSDYDLDVDTNEADENILTIFINHRVEDSRGRLLGVTGVGLKVDAVARLLKSFSEKYDKNIYLISPDGIVQAHYDKKMVMSLHSIKSMSGLSEIADSVLATRHSEPASFEYQKGEDTVLMTVRWIDELGWYLVVEQNETEAMVSARNNFFRTLGAGFLVTVVIVSISIATINHFQSRLEKQANTDELTGVANRRSFEQRFNSEVAWIGKNGGSFSVIILDIDDFKTVNDSCGHLEGDRIIRDISSRIESSIRGTDFCARWGGDEFIVLVSGGLEQAVSVAKRIRGSVKSLQFGDSCEGDFLERAVSLSAGVAEFKAGDTLDSLTMRADKAMYAAKEGGRNRVLSEREVDWNPSSADQ